MSGRKTPRRSEGKQRLKKVRQSQGRKKKARPDVFIGWAGRRSGSVALALKGWFDRFLPGGAFISVEIVKGARWFYDLSRHIKDAKCGVFCLTKENMSEEWIHFEAGGIMTRLGKERICPVLVDLAPTDIDGPFAHFQMTTITTPEMERLLKAVNQSLGSQALTDGQVRKSFRDSWPSLKREIAKAVKTTGSGGVQTSRELLEEISLNLRVAESQIEHGMEDREVLELLGRRFRRRFLELLGRGKAGGGPGLTREEKIELDGYFEQMLSPDRRLTDALQVLLSYRKVARKPRRQKAKSR